MDGSKNIDFIYEGKISKKVCKELIDLYESGENCDHKKLEGRIGKSVVNKDFKECTESYYNGNQLPSLFKKELQKNIEAYKKKYIYCDKMQETWGITEHVKIQKYNPSQFYKAWHFETNGTAGLIGNRFLVFMAYLNTVQKGGQTEYLYQKKKFKAEEGKLLIWPAYWTHTHRGCVAPKETKYIITGWFNYI
jgi:hypothetical protein